MRLRLFTAGLLLAFVPALTPPATPSPSPAPAVSRVDNNGGDDVIVPAPSSSSPPSSPPWVAFGIAVISLVGLGTAFFLAKHRGRHRLSRRNRDSIEYFEGNFYETEY